MPGFLDVTDHFPQHILLANWSKLEAVCTGGMVSEHEQLSCGCEILDPFNQQSVGRLLESNHIAAAGTSKEQGDFTNQYKIPVLIFRFQTAA